MNNKNNFEPQDENESKAELANLYKLILKNDPFLKEKYKKSHNNSNNILMINGKGNAQ